MFFFSYLRRLMYCLCCLCFFQGQHAAAQTTDHTMRHYTDVDGLPQNSVNGIVVDQYGYAWMTTQDGIVRFDGNDFRVFNKNNITGLHSNRFSHFRADTSGELYAVNDQSEFVGIGLTRMQMAPAFKSRVESKLWSLGYNSASSFWSKGYVDAWYGFPAKAKYFYSHNQEYFWECTSGNVALWQNGKRSREISFPGADPVRFFEMGSLLCYFHLGHFWHVSGDKMKAAAITGDLSRDPFFRQRPDSIVVYWNNLSEQVLLYCNHNLYLLKLAQDGVFTTTLLYHNVAIQPGEITCMYYDPSNKRLFVGSLTNGLYILQPQRFSVLTVNAPGKQNVYYAQTPMPGNKVLTGDGVLLGDTSTGRLVLPGMGDGYAIFTDYTGSIWKKEITRLYRYNVAMVLQDEWYFKNYVTCIYQGVDSVIRIGVRGSGLWQIDLRSSTQEPEFVCQLPSDICYMQQLEAGRLWIGTGNGLLYLNTRRKTLQAIAGLEGKYIRSLYLKSPEELWISTYEDGIFFYGNNKLVAMPVDRDNFLKASHCIIEDKKGYFWITTNKGLFQATREDMLRYVKGEQSQVYYQYYNKLDGFATNEFNGGCQPCALLLDNGKISLPSLNGLVWFDPSAMDLERTTEHTIVDYVTVNNQPYPFGGNRVVLPGKFEQLRIKLSAPYYGSKKNVQMWYRIEHQGDPSRWYAMGPDNNITFTNLAAGTHTLTIRKINGFGKDNYSVLTVQLVVPPPFYKTWWFFCLVILLGILAIIAYTQLRLAYMVRHNKQLESLVTKRTSMMNNTLQKLTLSELKLKQQTQLQEKIVAAIAHDIKSPLRFVVLANQRIYEHLEQGNTDAAQKISKDAYIAVDSTYHHIANFVAYVKAQMQQGMVQFEEVDLSAVVASKTTIFGLIARSRNMTINEMVDQRLRVYANYQLLSVIVHNLLDNATKYCARCELSVRTMLRDGQLQLLIADQGPGIDPAIATWLSTPEDKQAPDSYMPEGLGLLMVKELCALLKISIQVDVNEGTRIYLGFSSYKQ